MCGIAAAAGPGSRRVRVEAMVAAQRHRGPEGEGVFVSPSRTAVLGHNRLRIIDLSDAGRQPMSSPDGRLHLVFNGEIYNYVELRRELADYPYTSATDSEVVIPAFERWGMACLDRFVGMFAFAIWDERARSLVVARDRFGVKPVHYAIEADGTLLVSSEIKALHAAGWPVDADPIGWAGYLTRGFVDGSERTFWTGIRSLPPGHWLSWVDGRVDRHCWYDVAERSGSEIDHRSAADVEEEYFALLDDSVRLRFRSDVPVGICLSGGVDSSTLLGLVQRCQGPDSSVEAFTYVTGDSRYDELAWVDRMLAETRHPSVVCALHPAEVPALAESLQEHEDEPFGGLPTLAYSRVFERARSRGVTVLLDGQGLDEQWAGYDYYETAGRRGDPAPVVQGTSDAALRPECLVPAFGALAEAPARAAAFPDPLRQMQYRDIRDTKLPRALRFNDRASMRSSIELREPFLDHRLFELALRQPADRKIRDGVHKWLLRRMAARLLPSGVVEAPKRPLQTPQREWLRGPLRPWADACIEDGLAWRGGEWLDRGAVRRAWGRFADGEGDNSYFVWQWMSLGLLARLSATRRSNASARLGGARAPARPEPFVESGRP